MRISFMAVLLCVAAPAVGAQVDDRAAVAIAQRKELIVDKSLLPETKAAILRAVDAFYGSWNNGSQKLLDEAISPAFTDHELPPGRPQGPMVAAKGFLGAVPDLRCEVLQRLVVGDRVNSLLHFTGHFTGTFQGIKGKGQRIDFIAIDILAVRDGKITDNWHLEDNPTFQKQVGAIK